MSNKEATILINTFTQGVLFKIKNSTNYVVYSLDVFNNYFIKLPKEFYDKDNYYFILKVTLLNLMIYKDASLSKRV